MKTKFIAGLFLSAAIGANAQTVELTSDIPTTSITIGGGNSTHVGTNSGDNSTGNNNSFFGYHSGLSTTTGSQNTFLGYIAGRNNTIGIHNVFIGSKAGVASSTGSANVFVGRGSGIANSTGSSNVYVGNNTAYYTTTGNFNTFLGNHAGVSTVTGNENVMLGNYSGLNNNSTIGRNTFLGAFTGENNTGENNVFIGYQSGQNISGSNILSIANNNTTTPLVYGEFDNEKLIFNATVGIGTSNFPDPTYKLYVKDGIRTEKVKVDIASDNGWADYVFEDTYQLNTLEEVENYIKSNGHLKDIPSTQEVLENGIELAEMNKLLLQKIEELTLYAIEQDKKINALIEKFEEIKN